MANILEQGSSVLRPRARIIKIIGQELISNDNIAIIELVKNSYDAGAKSVKVIFSGDIAEGKGEIAVDDDGSGMTLDTVKKGWLEPATIIKKNKKSKDKTRKMLGEKGIGRFAAAKLSKKLEMLTKVAKGNEILAKFDWEDFNDDDRYLDEIACSWEVREPEKITDHGTILTLSGLDSKWDKEKLRELKVHLSRLVSPFKLVKGFEIYLILPDPFKELEGIINPPETLGKPDYMIKGSVNPSGTVMFEYFCKKENREESKDVKIEFKPPHVPKTGSFEFEFRVWDREKENLFRLATELKSILKDIERDLDEAAGISIYRDGFRVLPYGEPKDDWLRLDSRRVNNPTLRVSNNQIIGYVAISSESNPLLVDQSNREGIVESFAFKDLKESIIFILKELEERRYTVRHDQPKKSETTSGIFSKISVKPIIDMVEQKLPNDLEAKQTVAQTDARIKEGIREVQEVLSRYRRLATLGQLFDVVLHDGNGILLRLDNEVRLLEKDLKKEPENIKKIEPHIINIRLERQTLSELFKRLEPFGGRKRGRPKYIILEEAINNVFKLFESKINELKINVILPDSRTEVRFDEGELEQIFVNLLDNSLYWLDSLNQNEKKILVEVSKNDTELAVLFSDNGPGVSAANVDRIFEPYFSTKPNGIGLGLKIVGELVTEYDGSLDLISNGPLNGATFKLTFRRRF